jgi:hypothetical protein
MIKEATTYECDGPDCTKTVIVSKTNPVYGPSRVKDWILLLNSMCYCSVKCFMADKDEVPT